MSGVRAGETVEMRLADGHWCGVDWVAKDRSPSLTEYPYSPKRDKGPFSVPPVDVSFAGKSQVGTMRRRIILLLLWAIFRRRDDIKRAKIGQDGVQLS